MDKEEEKYDIKKHERKKELMELGHELLVEFFEIKEDYSVKRHKEKLELMNHAIKQKLNMLKAQLR